MSLSDSRACSLSLDTRITAQVKHDGKIRILGYGTQKNPGGGYFAFARWVFSPDGALESLRSSIKCRLQVSTSRDTSLVDGA